jgi:hypothetical protein
MVQNLTIFLGKLWSALEAFMCSQHHIGSTALEQC